MLIEERNLDICLMKASRRKVQRGGHIQFENLIYRGEYLAGYAGETVSLRFDPEDITTVWIYRREDNRDIFMTRAFAQDLETERLSYEEAKASSKRLRESGKALTNKSILQVSVENHALTKKKSRKQRQKEEQMTLAKKQQLPPPQVESAQSAESQQSRKEVNREDWAFEPIDFDALQGGW
jgi:putative transposase